MPGRFTDRIEAHIPGSKRAELGLNKNGAAIYKTSMLGELGLIKNGAPEPVVIEEQFRV